MAAKAKLDDTTEYYLETIFEDGSFSIAHSSIEAYLPGLIEHHNRAKNGLAGGPPDAQGRAAPAVRIKKVLVYENHPGEVTGNLTSDEWAERLKSILSTETVFNVYDLNARLLAEVQPLVESPAHESNYFAGEIGEIDPSRWGGDN